MEQARASEISDIRRPSLKDLAERAGMTEPFSLFDWISERQDRVLPEIADPDRSPGRDAPLSPEDEAGIRRLRQLAPVGSGNERVVFQLLSEGFHWQEVIWLLEPRSQAVASDVGGEPLGEGGLDRLLIVGSKVNDELIRAFADDPELMYKLEPRRFEELIVELYRRQGFNAILTPASGDGGSDVYVIENSALGRSLTVVQAKRYAPHHKVGVGIVRELLGTVSLFEASVGMLLTTSFFTKGARRLEEERPYRISLRDYFSLVELLQDGVGAGSPFTKTQEGEGGGPMPRT